MEIHDYIFDLKLNELLSQETKIRIFANRIEELFSIKNELKKTIINNSHINRPDKINENMVELEDSINKVVPILDDLIYEYSLIVDKEKRNNKSLDINEIIKKYNPDSIILAAEYIKTAKSEDLAKNNLKEFKGNVNRN